MFAESAAYDAQYELAGEERTITIGQGGATQEVKIKRFDNVSRSKLRSDVKLKLLAMWSPRYRQAAIREPAEGEGQTGEQRLIVDGGLPEGEP